MRYAARFQQFLNHLMVWGANVTPQALNQSARSCRSWVNVPKARIGVSSPGSRLPYASSIPRVFYFVLGNVASRYGQRLQRAKKGMSVTEALWCRHLSGYAIRSSGEWIRRSRRPAHRTRRLRSLWQETSIYCNGWSSCQAITAGDRLCGRNAGSFCQRIAKRLGTRGGSPGKRL